MISVIQSTSSEHDGDLEARPSRVAREVGLPYGTRMKSPQGGGTPFGELLGLHCGDCENGLALAGLVAWVARRCATGRNARDPISAAPGHGMCRRGLPKEIATQIHDEKQMYRDQDGQHDSSPPFVGSWLPGSGH